LSTSFRSGFALPALKRDGVAPVTGQQGFMKSIERVSIIDQVVHELKEMCLSGQLVAGDKLPTEMQLCETLNVGRSTVREAFRVLQAMGLIEMRPGRGAFLRDSSTVDPDGISRWFREHQIQLRDFMEVRMALEPLAVRLAIENGTEQDLAELEAVFANFEKGQKSRDVAGMVVADEAFHNAIAQASHNQLLILISRNIAEAFTEYRTRSFASGKIGDNALEPHRQIVKAIRRRDVHDAEKQMRSHLMISLRDIEEEVREET
jgi:GntR family transcriptional repressor for pyruvate dehydrogenase complex